MNNEAF
jgi:Eukaryotic aspartyl protease